MKKTGSRATKKKPAKSSSGAALAPPALNSRSGVAGGLLKAMTVAAGPKIAGTDESSQVSLDVELLSGIDPRLAGYGLIHITDPASDWFVAGGGWVLAVILTGGSEAVIDVGPTSDWRAIVGTAYLIERLVPGYPDKANSGTISQTELRQINDTLSKRPEEDLLVEYEIGRSVPTAWKRNDAWRPRWRGDLEKELGPIEAVFEVPGNAAWGSYRWAVPSDKDTFSDKGLAHDVVVLGIRAKDPHRRWVPIVSVAIPDPDGVFPMPELAEQGPRSYQWADLLGTDDPRRAGAYGWTWARLWALVDPSLDPRTLVALARAQEPIPAGNALPVRVSTTGKDDPLVPFGAVTDAVAKALSQRDPMMRDRLTALAFTEDGRPSRGAGYTDWLQHKLTQIDGLLYGQVRRDAALARAEAARRVEEARNQSARSRPSVRSQQLGPNDVRAFVPDVGTAIARHDPATDAWVVRGPSGTIVVSEGWRPRSLDVQRAAFLGWTKEQIETRAAQEIGAQHGIRTERQQDRAKQQGRTQRQRVASMPGPNDVFIVNGAGERIIARHDPATNAWVVHYPDRAVVVSVGWKPTRRDVERASSLEWTTEAIEKAAVQEQRAREQQQEARRRADEQQRKKQATSRNPLERLMASGSKLP